MSRQACQTTDVLGKTLKNTINYNETSRIAPGVTRNVMKVLFVFWRDSPPVGQGLLIHGVSRLHTTTHHSRQDSSGQVISPSQRPLPDNTQHSQQTSIHASGGIRTHNPSNREASDPRLGDRAAIGTGNMVKVGVEYQT